MILQGIVCQKLTVVIFLQCDYFKQFIFSIKEKTEVVLKSFYF